MAVKRYNTHTLSTLFRDYLVAENRSRATIHNYGSDFDHFMGWLSLNSPNNVTEITTDVGYLTKNLISFITDYKDYLVNKNVTSSTFTRKMYCLRKFGQACLELGLISALTYEAIIKVTRKESQTLHSWEDLLNDFNKDQPLKSKYIHSSTLDELKRSHF